MRRFGSTSLLLAAACSIGCHGDAGHDPPNRPRIGGPVSDFPRADLGEDENPPETANGSAPPPVVIPPPSSTHVPGALDEEAAATGDGTAGRPEAGDAGRSLNPAAELDAGAPDAETDASADAETDASTEVDADAAVDAASSANPARDDASPQADASLLCIDMPALCRDGA